METTNPRTLIRYSATLVAVTVAVGLVVGWYCGGTSPPTQEVPKTENVNCGPDSLAAALARLGFSVPIHSLKSRCQLTERGASFAELTRLANEYSVTAIQRWSSWDEIRQHGGTCVLFVGQSHFLAVDPRKVPDHEDQVWVYDPNCGVEWMRREELEAIWSGESLMISKSDVSRDGSAARFMTCWEDTGFLYSGNGVATYRFSFDNPGTQPLTIGIAHISCNCTVPSLSKTTLLPGEMAECVASVKLTGKRGRFHEYVTLKTNDAQNPEFLLNLTGGVYLDNILSKDSLSMGEIDQGTEVIDYIVAHDPGTDRLKIQGTTITLDESSLKSRVSFQCRVLPIGTFAPPRGAHSPRYAIRAGDVVIEVRLSVSPNALIGPIKALLEIQTAYDDHRANLPVAVDAIVRSDFHSTPKAVILSNTEKGKTSATLRLEKRSGGQVRVGQVIVTNGLPVEPSYSMDGDTAVRVDIRCDFSRLSEPNADGEVIVVLENQTACHVPIVIRSATTASTKPGD